MIGWGSRGRTVEFPLGDVSEVAHSGSSVTIRRKDGRSMSIDKGRLWLGVRRGGPKGN